MVSFRKRIKIAPGVNLNLSKGGISTSFGVKGASVSVGKRGVYINNGLPGTGIYKRTKISRSSTKKSHTLPVEIGETTNTQNLSDAQVLLNDLRSLVYFRIYIPDYIVSHNNIIKNPRSDPGCRFPSIFADVVLSTST